MEIHQRSSQRAFFPALGAAATNTTAYPTGRRWTSSRMDPNRNGRHLQLHVEKRSAALYVHRCPRPRGGPRVAVRSRASLRFADTALANSAFGIKGQMANRVGPEPGASNQVAASRGGADNLAAGRLEVGAEPIWPQACDGRPELAGSKVWTRPARYRFRRATIHQWFQPGGDGAPCRGHRSVPTAGRDPGPQSRRASPTGGPNRHSL